MQPLARANAGERDLNVASRLEAAEPDDAFGEIDDSNGLAHVEQIDGHIATVRPERVGRGGDDQVAGFADGHEIAHHVGMRDGDRAAGLDLRLEFRHHRAVGRQHVAEAHRDHTRGACPMAAQFLVERLAIHFRQPLGGAQHGDRFDRLVGGDHDHGGGTGGGRGVRDVDRAEHVGLDALVPVQFEQRHVLERGGVKDHIGHELRD